MVEKKIGTICVASEKHSKIKYLFFVVIVVVKSTEHAIAKKIVF